MAVGVFPFEALTDGNIQPLSASLRRFFLRYIAFCDDTEC